jgi:hypothetical protein
MQNHEWREQKKALRREQRSEARKRFGNSKRGPVSAGLIILLIGGALLLRQMDIDIDLPHWLFTWPMILVIVGIFVGIQTKFRDFGWLILCGIGSFFLIGKILPGKDIDRFIVPVALMGVGLAVIFGSRKKWGAKNNPDETAEITGTITDTPPPPTGNPGATGDDKVDTVSIFGNVKKTIYSKNFRGGEVVTIFGGAELNLTQADMQGPIYLELVQIFGGTKLVIPPHWEIRSEAVAIFGGIEDKRPPNSITSPDKVLILEGTVLFGGIEIKSY